MRRNFNKILSEDARGNQRILSISAVVEDEVFAQVGLVSRAKVAHVAGSGIRGHHAHTFSKSVFHIRSHFFHDPSEFVAEEGRRLYHPSVIALLPHFKVRATRERGHHTDQYLPRTHSRDIHSLN